MRRCMAWSCPPGGLRHKTSWQGPTSAWIISANMGVQLALVAQIGEFGDGVEKVGHAIQRGKSAV
jgi:hypothetical protein